MKKQLRPILFLDIDGVMKPIATNKFADRQHGFSSVAVEALRKVVTTTECDVVISSTWRIDQMDKLRDELTVYNLQVVAERIIDVTPILDPTDGPTREDEIDKWLYEAKFSGRIAILDDEPFQHELGEWLVQTNQEIGLTPAHSSKAIHLLVSGPVFSYAV